MEFNCIDEKSSLQESENRCRVCTRKANALCTTCDNIYMCPKCIEIHNRDPKVKGHKVLCLCSQHDKPLSLYCRSCKRAICSVCKLSVHNSYKHDVSPHRDVFVEALVAISDATPELQNALTRVREKETELNTYYEMVKRLPKSAEEYRVTAVVVRVEECLHSLNSRKMAITAKLQTDVTCNSILDTQSVQNLITTSEDHLELASASNDPDTATLIESIKKRIDLGNTEPANLANTEELRSRTIRLKPLKSVSFSFWFPWPCHEVLRMRALPDGCLAILGRHAQADFPPTRLLSPPFSFGAIRTEVLLYTHDPVANMTEILTDGPELNVDSASDIAITSFGELIVGYTEGNEWPISKFNIQTGDIMRIKANQISGVNSIETDGANNIFCTTSKGLYLVKLNGNAECVIKNENGGWKKMAFCKVTGILYIVEHDRISGFMWNDRERTLRQSPTLTLSVSAILTDIAISDRGAILVTGTIERGMGFMIGPEIRVFQMMQASDTEIMERVHFHDYSQRRSHWRHEWNPTVCVQKDQLWLGCGSRVELCEMTTDGIDLIAANKMSLNQVLQVLPFRDTMLRWSLLKSVMVLLFLLVFVLLLLYHRPTGTCIDTFLVWACLTIITLNLFVEDGPYDHQLDPTIRELSVLKKSAITLFAMIIATIIFLGTVPFVVLFVVTYLPYRFAVAFPDNMFVIAISPLVNDMKSWIRAKEA